MAASLNDSYAFAFTFAVTAIDALYVCWANAVEDPSNTTAAAIAPLQTAFFMTPAPNWCPGC